MKLKNLIYFGIVIILISACKKEQVGEIPPPQTQDKEYQLFIDFWNPDGDNPQISFDVQSLLPGARLNVTKIKYRQLNLPPEVVEALVVRSNRMYR